MITRLEFGVLISELERLDRPEINEIFEEIREPKINQLNNSLEKNGVRVENRGEYPTIKGYHLCDIINR